MAVSQTSVIYKALTIDGQSSRNYGVYITGEAVFNAPEREVEMISIPGRNGQLALDKGRFENIEVTYPAGIFADSEADFAEAISEFRNFLCSRGGYVRIQDDYNPNEYRMGVYKSGLEVSPAMLRAGEFGITFDCKPQRWLLNGESPIDVGEEISFLKRGDLNKEIVRRKSYDNSFIIREAISEGALPAFSVNGQLRFLGITVNNVTAAFNSYVFNDYVGEWITVSGESPDVLNYAITKPLVFTIGEGAVYSASVPIVIKYYSNPTYYTDDCNLNIVVEYDGDATIKMTMTLEGIALLMADGYPAIRFNDNDRDYPQNGFSTTGFKIVSAGVINTTCFDAKPLLLANGYGAINLNGTEIIVSNTTIGEIQLSNDVNTGVSVIDVSNLIDGDAIFKKANTSPRVTIYITNTGSGALTITKNSVSGGSAEVGVINRTGWVDIFPSGVSFVKGTQTVTTTEVGLTISGGGGTGNVTITITMSYNGYDAVSFGMEESGGYPPGVRMSHRAVNHPAYYGISTKSALPNPLYIDLDSGEAYGEEGGEMLNLNNVVQLPPKLPQLTLGANQIIFDNTINSLKVVPRWWRV